MLILHELRAAVQHLALFVPWESFLSVEEGDINVVWTREKQALPRRLSFVADNVQLLRRSAEDAKRDAKQWAASSGDGDPTNEATEFGVNEVDEGAVPVYRSDNIGDATRLVDVVRAAAGANQITAGSKELTRMTQQLCRFQQLTLCSKGELQASVEPGRGTRKINLPGRPFSGAEIPVQSQVRPIKSQQTSASRETERMIQGMQNVAENGLTSSRSAAMRSVLSGFGEQDIHVTAADSESMSLDKGPIAKVSFGPSTSFLEAGRQVVELFMLNRK
ncbi:hypothetical protein B0T10DRAFT_152756 [Thelonectria olida]|uniref:Uncharacterized protein n=1 Tax=Thelonectria olida TaxID=1576542 RepID=A0A9P8VVP4_9HYPO|nr:hypothetical protein B0T10DRAFT_152756 [Thelonectria olida]